ncbi:MAG: formate dehydrogenase subunit delta [Alphaproteobacteria bacterium]|nr:MAG: formate dehydrogenase subunit delta [Alphaproteobacteria bacterium]
METDRMLHKANQIALNFAAYPRLQAVDYVAEHIRKFWPPMMRQQIIAHVQGGGHGLHELAIDAVKILKE